ncbi:MAG: EamA family transporter RarD [Clostridiales bacterium]|nr:EamA family transporter RarD [Clostridiales bacterium]
MNEGKKGTIFIIIAYVLWGLFPFYWAQLSHVSSIEIIAYRILFSFILCLIYLIYKKELSVFDIFKNFKSTLRFIFISLLLFINWFTFIYAVTNNMVIDAGMGYYLNPIISILLGILFLKEKLGKLQIAAFTLAVLGIVYYIVSMGVIPYITLILGTTFGVYGLFKKKTTLSGMHSMSIETALLTPIALIILFVVSKNSDISLFIGDIKTITFIVFAGFITLTPLVLFAEATKRIPLTRVGFLQLIAPTMMLITGLVMGEDFSFNRIISLSFIWVALIIYSISIMKGDDNDRKNNKRLSTNSRKS